MSIIKRIILDVTSKCNLQCPMYWGPPRKFDISKNQYIDNELSLPQIKKILEFMKINFESSILTINGGEPLTRTDIIEILKLAKKLNYSITLSTNAILFNDKIEIIKYLDAIAIPIDGITTRISSIMRPPVKNHHNFALQAIEKINNLNIKIHLKVSSVVTGLNSHEIIKIGDEMRKRKLKINVWKLFQYKSVGYRQNNILKGSLLISKKEFNKITKIAKDKFSEYNIHSQSNEDKGLYILIRPDGSITTQEDKNGTINPELGNIISENKETIIQNLEGVINPIAESDNAKKSYNL